MEGSVDLGFWTSRRDRYFIAEQPVPAPHLAHPEECADLRIVLVVIRSCEHFPDGFDLHLRHDESNRVRRGASPSTPNSFSGIFGFDWPKFDRSLGVFKAFYNNVQ